MAGLASDKYEAFVEPFRRKMALKVLRKKKKKKE